MAYPRSSINGLVETQLRFSQDDAPAFQCTLHARTVGGSANTLAGMASLAASIEAAVDGVLMPNLTNHCTLVDVAVQDLGPTRLVAQIEPSNTVGGLAGAALPGNAAMVCTTLTGMIGRAYRGRIYFGGFGAGSLADASTWDAGYMSAIDDSYAAWIAGMAAATPVYKAVLYHRENTADPGPLDDTTTDLVDRLVRAAVYKQGKRSKPS